MKEEDRGGVLMRGLGRWLVYSRPRAWFGMAVEIPNLLREVRIPRGATCLDIATGIGWASRGVLRREASVRIVALDYDGTILPRTREYLRSHGAAATLRRVGPTPSICRFARAVSTSCFAYTGCITFVATSQRCMRSHVCSSQAGRSH